jgi:hypothetical protein
MTGSAIALGLLILLAMGVIAVWIDRETRPRPLKRRFTK